MNFQAVGSMPSATLYQEPPAKVPVRGPLLCQECVPSDAPSPPAAINVSASAASLRRELFMPL